MLFDTYKELAIIERVKIEILDDMADGTIPRTVSSFSELHDFVDANCYGGFCDDTGLADDNSDASHETVYRVQTTVNEWLMNRQGVK